MINNQLLAPSKIPKKIDMKKEVAPPPKFSGTGIAGATGPAGSGVLGGILGGMGSGPVVKVAPPKKLNVSSGVMAGNLQSKVMPIYPAIAKAARIQGTVVLHALISKDGRIIDIKVASGPPMLQQAALEAVRQWRYKPYLLNGEPVEVETTINVVFNLED